MQKSNLLLGIIIIIMIAACCFYIFTLPDQPIEKSSDNTNLPVIKQITHEEISLENQQISEEETQTPEQITTPTTKPKEQPENKKTQPLVSKTDPDADRRARFQNQMKEFATLARGEDCYQYAIRMYEPGTEMYAKIQSDFRDYYNHPPHVYEHLRIKFRKQARFFESLKYDTLEWIDGEAIIDHHLNNMVTKLYETQGKWYIKQDKAEK